MIPLPEPDHTTPIKFGCDGLWFSVAKLRAYGDDVRAEERERCAQICDGFASCEGIAQQCAQAIRDAGAERAP